MNLVCIKLVCGPSETNHDTGSMEVKRISAARFRTIYESMTENKKALELLAIGIVQGISTIVQPPCEDPQPF